MPLSRSETQAIETVCFLQWHAADQEDPVSGAFKLPGLDSNQQPSG
jgi:hypothetical protein